jgi:peroxiredoxin
MIRISFLLTLLIFSAAAMSGEGAKVGDPVPDISAPDENGKDVKLADFKGKHGLIIFFYPRADTPG